VTPAPAGGAALAALVATVADAFPPQWAEPWDRVGLLAGDPDAPAGPVLAALDPTLAIIAAAEAVGARTVLTHHPAFLETPAHVPGFGPSGVVFAAVKAGIALVAAHTNLDRSPEGGDALAHALGLRILAPLERSTQPMELVTVYAPPQAAEAVAQAMEAAGAGRIGRYEGCAFSAPGTGRFAPMEGASPQAGTPATPGDALTAEEVRLEMVASPGGGARAAQAARAAHPYEEPLITVTTVAMTRSAARLGRLCEPPRPMTLLELSTHTGATLGCAPRLWGDPDAPTDLIATASGSGGSMIRDALAAGANVLLTGELRYHDALNALDAGLTVVEAGHDATEWPMVPVLAAAASTTPGLTREDVTVAERPTLWRTA
jgi:dinuclear metal center YbgI/SA1388 family protein